MLGASLDLEVFQTHALEFVGQRLDGLGQITLANLAALGHHAGDALIRLGLQIEERKVFELPFYGRDAQAIRQRSVDVHGLARLEQAAVLSKRRQRSHVVQAVCQLDDNHANVTAHSKEHLSQVERLLLVHAVDFDVGELGHAVDQLGHGGTEQVGHVGKRCLRVLDRVMQQRSAHHVAIHLSSARMMATSTDG